MSRNNAKPSNVRRNQTRNPNVEVSSIVDSAVGERPQDSTDQSCLTTTAPLGEFDAIAQQIDKALDGESIEESLNGLENRLDHSERLVRLLTEKLEMTAAELSRVRGKTQANKADSRQFEELSNEQQALRMLLNEFEEEWQDRYEGPALQKVSGQLEDVLGEIQRLPKTVAEVASDSFNQVEQSEYRYKGIPGDESSDNSIPESDPLDESNNEPDDDEAVEEIVESEAISLCDTLKIVMIDPHEVDFAADDDDLNECFSKLEDTPSKDAPIDERETAVQSRDRCIEALGQQQRQIVEHFNRSLDSLCEEWEASNPNKDEARELETLKALVHEQLRVAEIGISLSRAALSRERSAIDYERSQQKRVKAEPEKPLGANETPIMRRWIRFLGR